MLSFELEQFIDTKSFESLGQLMEVISKEKLSAKTLGVSYRTICHWDEKGIIRFKRDNPDSRRKYSFVDYIWIKVVSELRSFGVELPIIQKIVQEIYSPIPVRDVFSFLAENKNAIGMIEEQINELNLLEQTPVNLENKKELQDYLAFLKSGEYKSADFTGIEVHFNYLHAIIAEIIATKKPVSIIVFKNGDWFPFIKDNERLYSEDLLYKKEYESQVSVSLTNLVFNFILEENMSGYYTEFNLMSPEEINLLDIVAKGKYKKITILYKSKKLPPIEILKSKSAQEELVKVFRKKNYREFIVTDNKDKEFRIKVEKHTVDLSQGVKDIILTDTSYKG